MAIAPIDLTLTIGGAAVSGWTIEVTVHLALPEGTVGLAGPGECTVDLYKVGRWVPFLGAPTIADGTLLLSGVTDDHGVVSFDGGLEGYHGQQFTIATGLVEYWCGYVVLVTHNPTGASGYLPVYLGYASEGNWLAG